MKRHTFDKNIYMKKITLLLLTLLAFQYSFAQQKFKEGSITYAMKIEGLPEDDPSVAMLGDMKMILTFKDVRSKVEMAMGIMNMSVFSNTKTKEYVNCMDLMGTKMAITMTQKDLDESAKEKGHVQEIIKTDETKKILDYNCKKAIVKIQKGDELLEMPIWYTSDIKMDVKNPNDQFEGKIDGLPLEYSTTMNGMNIHINVEKVEFTKIDNSTFNIPADYERMTMEEFQTKMSNFGK